MKYDALWSMTSYKHEALPCDAAHPYLESYNTYKPEIFRGKPCLARSRRRAA